LPVTKAIRRLINDRKTSDDIRVEAIEEGMITLREDVKRLVLEGITSIDELLRITFKVD
jgi:type IV pilus assembly protein PilB